MGVSTSTKSCAASVRAERRDQGVAHLEHLAGLVVDDEVGVALPVAGVGVGEALPLVRQRAYGLGQQLEAVHLHGQLALAGDHHRALGAHPVPEIEAIEPLVGRVAQHAPGCEELQLARAVPHGGERQLALAAQEHEAAGDPHPVLGLGPRLQVGVPGPQLAQGVGPVEAVRVRIRAALPQRLELGQAARLLRRQPVRVFGALVELRAVVQLHGRFTLATPPWPGPKDDDMVTDLACPP